MTVISNLFILLKVRSEYHYTENSSTIIFFMPLVSTWIIPFFQLEVFEKNLLLTTHLARCFRQSLKVLLNMKFVIKEYSILKSKTHIKPWKSAASLKKDTPRSPTCITHTKTLLSLLVLKSTSGEISTDKLKVIHNSICFYFIKSTLYMHTALSKHMNLWSSCLRQGENLLKQRRSQILLQNFDNWAH